MPPRQTFRNLPARTLPRLWLLTDPRTAAALPQALRRLPRGAGVIVRDYHLAPEARARHFAAIARAGRARGLTVVWAGDAGTARRVGADGCYGAPRQVRRGVAGLRLVTAHSLRELGEAHRARAAAVLLSPVFATRSHPGARGLGPVRWQLLARRSVVPVIALGGMTAARARRLPGFGWAAIDGLAAGRGARIPKLS